MKDVKDVERSSPEQERLQTFEEGNPGRSHQYLSEIYNMFALYSTRSLGALQALTSSWRPFEPLNFAVRLSRPDKSGLAQISGHLGKIARIMPGFL